MKRSTKKTTPAPTIADAIDAVTGPAPEPSREQLIQYNQNLNTALKQVSLALVNLAAQINAVTLN